MVSAASTHANESPRSMNRMRRSVALLRMITVGTVIACSSSTAPEQRDLALARQRWVLGNVRSYEYVGRRSCGECWPDAVRPIIVTVTDGVVTRRVYADTGEPVTSSVTDFTTVEALFAVVEAAYARHAALVDASYDPISGVPLSIYIDGNLQTVDDEVGYYVSAFHSR
jgi:hypothetical protein